MRIGSGSLVLVLIAGSACGSSSGALGAVCDASQPCAPGGSCVVGRCRAAGAPPFSADSARVVLRPADIAVLASGAAPDTIAFGRASLGSLVVLLRFSPSWREDAEIDGAFVVLDPLEGAPPAQRPVRVEVARIRQPWTGASASWGRQPQLAPADLAAVVRPAPPAPLRLDVTAIVREWKRRADDDHGIALLAAGDDPFGAVYATGLTSGAPPVLEVYFR